MSNTPDVKVRVSGEDEGVSTLLKTLSKQLAEVQKQQRATNAETAKGATAQQSLAKSITGTISHLRQLAVGYAAVRAAQFVKDQIDAADALSKLSQKSGVTTETLSALAFAGKTADVSIDQLGTGAKLFAKSVADLARGGVDASDAFESIGLSAKALKGLSPDQAFLKTLGALGSYRDGLEKTEVAQKIFGRSGAELIPLANQIAEEGFGSISAAAAKAGQLISGDAGKAAEKFNDQLATLKAQAGGAALAFGKEVVPAISDVLSAFSDMKGEGEQAFATTFGQQAAKFIRETGAEALGIIKGIGAELKDLGIIGTETWASIKSAAKGDFGEAKLHFNNASKAFEDLKTAGVRGFQQARDALDKAEKERDGKSSDARRKRSDSETRDIILHDRKAALEIAKAREEAEAHARESEGKILAANLAIRDQQVERAFSQGLSSLNDYFAARRKTIVDAGAQEVAAMKATRDAIAKLPVTNEAERIKRDDTVAQQNAAIAVRELQTKQQSAALDAQREDQAKALADAVVDAEVRMQTARGNTSAEARRTLDKDVEEYAKAIRKMGKLTPEQQLAKVAEFKTTLTLDIDAKATQEKIDQVFGEIAQKREELDRNVSLGMTSQAQAQLDLANFEKARLPVLTDLADQMERFANALGNQDLIAQAQALKIKLGEIGTVTSESARLAASFTTDVLDATKGDLSEFLGSTVSQVHSVGEAFASLASSVVSSIQRIVAQLLAAKIVESIAGLLFSGAGAAIKVATPGEVNAGIVAGIKKARGGYISGPGGPTADAIPAWLSNGEYVVRAAAVRKIGIRTLDEINGLRTPSIVRPRRGYASGGLVAASPVASVSGNITGTLHLEVDEGVIVRAASAYLESGDGQKQQLRVLRRHKGTVSHLLGSG